MDNILAQHCYGFITILSVFCHLLAAMPNPMASSPVDTLLDFTGVGGPNAYGEAMLLRFCSRCMLQPRKIIPANMISESGTITAGAFENTIPSPARAEHRSPAKPLRNPLSTRK
jgi:hypothetical protein